MTEEVYYAGDVALEVEVATSSEETPDQPPLPESNAFVDAIAQNQEMAEIYQRKPHLLRQAWNSVFASKAPGTIKAYSATAGHFRSFCAENDYAFPLFPPAALLEFILEKAAAGSSFSSLATIQPAVTLLEECLGRPSSFTPVMEAAILGTKKLRRAAAGPVKKAPPIKVSDLRRLMDRFVIPFYGDMGRADAEHLRNVFRIIVEFHTLCRLSCFRKLQALHFEKVDSDILVTFPSAKNDQFHEGRSSFLMASDSPYCPVKLTVAFIRQVRPQVQLRKQGRGPPS